MNIEKTGFHRLTGSEAETFQLGEKLGSLLSSETCIALQGPLGAGKTVFVKGIIRGLGCEEPVTSPSFVLVQKYEGRYPIYHVDLYRLEEGTSAEEVGLPEIFNSNAVVLVEWAERWGAKLPKAMWITMMRTGESERKLSFHGNWSPHILKEIIL